MILATNTKKTMSTYASPSKLSDAFRLIAAHKHTRSDTDAASRRSDTQAICRDAMNYCKRRLYQETT